MESVPIGRHLYLAQRATHDALDRRLREHGASVWSWVLLREAASGEDASQRELADSMRIEPPTLVRHLDKLAEEGLVERKPDQHDRRVTRVVVTPAGQRRLARLHEVVLELDTELRGILTTREASVLEHALPRIHAYFSEQEHSANQVHPDKNQEAARARSL
jgi:MarR family transcriptional regulator for hemolysin